MSDKMDLYVNLCAVFSMHNACSEINKKKTKHINFYYDHFHSIMQGTMMLSLQKEVSSVSCNSIKNRFPGLHLAKSIKEIRLKNISYALLEKRSFFCEM